MRRARSLAVRRFGHASALVVVVPRGQDRAGTSTGKSWRLKVPKNALRLTITTASREGLHSRDFTEDTHTSERDCNHAPENFAAAEAPTCAR